MTRNKSLMKKRAGGGVRSVGNSGGSSSSGKPKIVIKPFVKPPTLPPNFYEQTSTELLQGTLDCVFNASTSTSSRSQSLSLQNAYQQVVNLVSHQYGPRLYHDLIETMQHACQQFVLPDDDEIVQLALSNYQQHGSGPVPAGGLAAGTSVASEAQAFLNKVQLKYQKYVDYLLLCKHIFLPLDSSHVYNVTTLQAVCITSTHGNGGNKYRASTAAAIPNLTMSTNKQQEQNNMTMGLWQVGLEQFKKRLLEFHLDDIIYQKWWESLQIDWNDVDYDAGVGSLAGQSSSTTTSALSLEHQTLLQDTLYMWQDLNVLNATLARRLEPDLIAFLQAKSEMLKTTLGAAGAGSVGSSTATGVATTDGTSHYNSARVISYSYSKWMHVAYHWNRFLPKATCIYLLENYLFKPHLRTEWLLNPSNFDAILEEAFSTLSSTPSSLMMTTNNSSGSAVVSTSSPIQQLWMLAGRLPGGYKQVGESIARYARQRGTSLMVSMGTELNKSNNKQKIGQLLELQKNIQRLLSQLPHSTEYCLLKPVWEDVVNPSIGDDHDDGANLVADALAKYVDSCLKDNKRQPSLHTTATGADSDNWAEAIIHGIFCFLQAKDIFEGFYKKDLAKRLLGNRVISMDVERHFVSLLKAECGAGYTSKMEGMFQDMDWSRETTNMYKDSLYKEAGSTSETLEMDIQVLTTGYWPVYPQYPNLILPPEMKVPQDHFTEYYKSKFQGRRMTWQYAIGQMVVRFKPQESGPKYDLLVSPTQALVLMQFNGNDEMTLPQVMAAVGLEDRADTELILLGLSLGKDGTRVLQKCDYDADKKKKTRPTVHDEDKFRVQDAFKSNARRIKINNILMKETKEEREKTVEAVSRDRLYYIDAVLVRIMKARKTVLHRDLIPQVLEQIKFPAQPADVKKRIEVLIEREYMERDSVDRNRYTYLA